MTVAELIKKLESMPQNVPVYAEGELANKVIMENCQGNIYVRIFKGWEKVDITNDVTASSVHDKREPVADILKSGFTKVSHELDCIVKELHALNKKK